MTNISLLNNKIFKFFTRIGRRTMENTILRFRWITRTRGRGDLLSGQFQGLDRCRVVFINLDHREDRRLEMEEQLITLGINRFERFSAVRRENGAHGCAESHLSVIESWADDSNDLLMVCEDDCEFLLARNDIDNLIEKFVLDKSLHVLCLAFNSFNGVKISNDLKITSNTQTMSCYVIKSSAKRFLENAARRSIMSFLVGRNASPIDIEWKKEQQKLFFSISPGENL